MLRIRTWLALLVFFSVIAGLYSRVTKIEQQSLWSDELVSVSSVRLLQPSKNSSFFERKHVHNTTLEDSFITYRAAGHTPPLFEMMLFISTKLFGDSETAIRLPSVIASILLLFLVPYYLFKRFGLVSAATSSVLIAFSPISIILSHEARAYSIGLLLSALASMKLVSSILNSRRNNSVAPGLTLTEVLIHSLLAFVHHYGLILSYLLLVPRILYILFTSWPEKKSAIITREIGKMACIAILPLCWLYFNIHAILQASRGEFRYFNHSWGYILFQGIDHLYPFGAVGALVTLCMLLCIWAVNKMRRKNHSSTLPANSISQDSLRSSLILLSVSCIYLFFLTRLDATSGNFHVRHFSLIIPTLYIGIAILAEYAIGLKRNLCFMLFLLLGLLIYQSQSKINELRESFVKEQYREAAEYIAGKYSTGDLIITTWKPNAGFYLFYLQKMKGEGIRKDIQTFSFKEEANQICQLASQKLSENKNIFIFYHIQHIQLVNDLKATCGALNKLQNHYYTGLAVASADPE